MGADSPSPHSKRSASQDIEDVARTPVSGRPDSDELDSESAQLDRMDLAPVAGSSTAASAGRPSAEDQCALILPLMAQSLQPHTRVYIIKRSWYRLWQAAVMAGEEDRSVEVLGVGDVPAVDNVGLLDGGGRLAELPKVGQNIIIATEEAYDHWRAWFGENGPGVHRRVIQRPNDSIGTVDFYPPVVRACRVVSAKPDAADEPVFDSVQLSLNDTVGTLRANLRAKLRLPGDAEHRLWRYTPPKGSDPSAVLSSQAAEEVAPRFVVASDIASELASFEKIGELSDAQTLGEAGFDEADIYLAVEVQDDDQQWIVPDGGPAQTASKPNFGGGFFAKKMGAATNGMSVKYKAKEALSAPSASSLTPVASASTSSPNSSRIVTRSQTGMASRVKGLTGLQNLGNTCFMNSALQCLSNTPELQQYFASELWREELNPDNPLGMDGQVAKAFAELMSRLWAGNATSYAPREFKQTIGRFRPMFLGWSQQDSQELIAFLLDGLHEDLNRVRQKPYTEIPDWEGEPTPERMYRHAAHIWDLYKRRNDSVMIDLFFGQFRSTLTCLECGKVSYKFDEFSSVTLSLPKKLWRGQFIVVPLDPAKPRTKLRLELSPDASFKDAKAKAAQVLQLNPKTLFCAEIFSHKFYRIFNDYDPISKIQNNDVIVLAELPFAYQQARISPRAKTFTTIAERDAADGKIVLPVVHCPKREGSSIVKGISNSLTGRSADTAGEPLIVGLRPEDTKSYQTLYAALLRAAAHFSRRGADMFDSADALGDDDDKASSPLALDPGCSPVLPTDSTPCENLFKIYVTSQTDSSLPHDFDARHYVDLEKRLSQRAQEKRPAGFIPGAFPRSEEDETSSSSAAAKPTDVNGGTNVSGAIAEDTPAWPVVSSGDGIYLEWSASAWKHFFGPENALFEDHITLEDPDIAKTTENRKAQKLSLDSCLSDFCKPERLGEDNPWRCPVCDKLQENTSKQMDLWKVPDILVIHLKRFSKSGYSWEKTSDTVEFPLENWDLTDRVEGRRVANTLKQTPEGRALLGRDFEDGPLCYDLFAVDCHYGGMGGGHYTAFAKNALDQRWHNFDDSHVSDVNEESVKGNAAYLLFYRRRTTKALGGDTHEKVTSALQSRSVSELGDDDHMRHSGTLNGTSAGSTLQHGLLTPPDEDAIEQDRTLRSVSIREPNGEKSAYPPVALDRTDSWHDAHSANSRRRSLDSNDADAGSDGDVGYGPPNLTDTSTWTSIDDTEDDLPDAAASSAPWPRRAGDIQVQFPSPAPEGKMLPRSVYERDDDDLVVIPSQVPPPLDDDYVHVSKR